MMMEGRQRISPAAAKSATDALVMISPSNSLRPFKTWASRIPNAFKRATQIEPCFIEYFRMEMEGKLYGTRAEPVKGTVTIPTAPGLGLDPDLDFIKEYRVAG